MSAALVALLAGLLAALLLTPLVGALAWRMGLVDVPGGRHAHARPTPRLGGLALLGAIATATTLGGFAAGAAPDRLWPVCATSALVCALGVVDDRRPLRPRVKLAGLGAAGLALAVAGVRMPALDVPLWGTVELGFLAWPLTVVWVVACANAVNLIDGLDGAAAGIGAGAALCLTLAALAGGDGIAAIPLAATAGACAGFLRHNRWPARIFLGDSGALLLGFVLAAATALACATRSSRLPAAALLALAVPLLDAACCFCRRFAGAWSGCGWRALRAALAATAIADQGHVHHRLLRQGLTPRQVARVLSLATLGAGAAAWLVCMPGRPSWPLAALAGASTLAGLLWLLAVRGRSATPAGAAR